MKVTVEVDEIFDVDGDEIEKIVEERLVRVISDKILKKLSDNTINQMIMNMQEQIDKRLHGILEGFIDRPIDITDKWGEIIERHENVSDLLKNSFDIYMSQAVDKDGRALKGCAISKDSNRLFYILDERIRKTVDPIAVEVARTADRKITNRFNDTLRREISDKLADKYVKMAAD